MSPPPLHLTRLLGGSEELGESAPSVLGQGQGGWILERLGAMTCWCASAGVAALTVYDADGSIAASVDDLVRTSCSALDNSPLTTCAMAVQSSGAAEGALFRGFMCASMSASSPTAHMPMSVAVVASAGRRAAAKSAARVDIWREKESHGVSAPRKRQCSGRTRWGG